MTAALPYRIATLLYVFDTQDRVLLLERARDPNRGRWSPPGGKLKTTIGESPYACASREAREELGLSLAPGDLRIAGLISEQGYEASANWLMFLFEVRPRIDRVPPPIDEGRFAFFSRANLDKLPLPDTDRESIWPLFWSHRGGFFAAHCRCRPGLPNEWRIEESRPGREPAASPVA